MEELKTLAYFSLVRSILEYASQVCDPYQVGQINELQKVQRRAAGFVKKDYSPYSSPSSMIADLGWQELAQCRRDPSLTLFYKIVNGDIAILTKGNSS